jgi:hypothetical protein
LTLNGAVAGDSRPSLRIGRTGIKPVVATMFRNPRGRIYASRHRRRGACLLSCPVIPERGT